jgi:hypothetical protein
MEDWVDISKNRSSKKICMVVENIDKSHLELCDSWETFGKEHAEAIVANTTKGPQNTMTSYEKTLDSLGVTATKNLVKNDATVNSIQDKLQRIKVIVKKLKAKMEESELPISTCFACA